MNLTEDEHRQIVKQREDAERKRIWWETCPKKKCGCCGSAMWAENPYHNCLVCDLL